MGKKQKKGVTSKVKDEVLESHEEMDIKTEDEIKEEPEEAEIKKNPRARLIVRNVSFKATEDKLREHFSPYGQIAEIKLLRRPDGRLVGCGFVEYSLKNCAAKAIAHTSGKLFLNRPVVVDWAIPKAKFANKNQKPAEDDSEESGFHEENDEKLHKMKKEDESDSDDGKDNDGDSDDGDDNEVDDGSDDDEVDDGSDDDDDDSQESSDEDDSDMDEDKGSKKRKKQNKQNKDLGLTPRKPLRESHDISEGCTVFVKNIPFSVNNEEFKKSMRRFGLIYYALICVDHLTEHSKGTGFVKFRTKDAADACIAAGREGEISIHGSVVETLPAQNREDLSKGGKDKDVKRDSRHLYLVKEGIILAGSPAAAGVSQADMAKRLQLEQWKTQMLRNLNKFVSLYRLVVQNLPPSYDDAKLRALMIKHGGPNAVVTEARVMRDLRNVDANGIGKSKEFGFVTFTTHESALHALRSLNNNPNTFTPVKRPIVAFSIEDKTALKTRQKRLEKSKAGLLRSQTNGGSQKEWEKQRREGKYQNNQFGGKSQGLKGKIDRPTISKTDTSPAANSSQPLTRKEKRKLKLLAFHDKKRNRKTTGATVDNVEGSNFMGETSKPGQSGIMSRKKLRAQVEQQAEATKAKNKRERKRQQLEAVKIKQPKQKMNKPKQMREEDNFSILVNKYKTQLASSETDRKKWYEN
ncbi:RNA-binding protein 28 [Thrips palmi]|uniref:RNA-binding protein 28 n=1 Tax=Thrips palmi TaxID=161013 RepID=A0A6P8YU70_THRPL|nr:RNA-binding protein 28 [Thrips palmi]